MLSLLIIKSPSPSFLKLNNVNIRTELYYDSSTIKKLEATNISFGDDIEHTRENSNIEIKADK